jgi:hypothetical protein
VKLFVQQSTNQPAEGKSLHACGSQHDTFTYRSNIELIVSYAFQVLICILKFLYIDVLGRHEQIGDSTHESFSKIAHRRPRRLRSRSPCSSHKTSERLHKSRSPTPSLGVSLVRTKLA